MMLILRMLGFLIVAYAAVTLLMYIFQRNLQYFPHQPMPASPAEAGVPQMKEITVVTEDHLRLIGWYAAPPSKDSKVILFFHGNGGNISHRTGKAAYFIESGYGVYLAEYRGYGGNPGKPSEAGLYKDARAAAKFLMEQGISPQRIIVYGESIGTGPAIEISREIQPYQLILEAPFSSILAIARQVYYWMPVDFILKDKFDNMPKIKDIKSPLLIVHGDEDGTVPISLTKELYEAANHPKEFITINGAGHNDLYEHHAGHVILERLTKRAKEDHDKSR